MLNECRGRVDKFSENFNRDMKNKKMEMEIIKGNQSEMENTLFEKSILEGINRVDKEEDQTTKIENGEAKDTLSEWQEKRSQNYNNNLRSLWDEITCKNICVIGIPEEGEQETEYIFEEIMMENFPNLEKEIDIQPQEAQRVQKKKEPKEAHTKIHYN